MVIKFKRVRYKNFLSTGDEFIEILLDKFPTTICTGANGVGKSILLDALSFCLFGVPFRNINIPALVNDTNGADLVAECEFNIGNTNYQIRRGLKPKIFEIFKNGKLINQDAKSKDYQKHLEQNIIKLNKKTFNQVVVLGSASFVPFMQLPAAERRFIIEDLLDIQIFSSMNVVLKQTVSEMKEQFVSISNQIEIQEEKVSLVNSYLKKIHSDNISAINDKKKNITENLQKRKEILEQSNALLEEIERLISSITDKENIQKRIKKLELAEDKLKNSKSKVHQEKMFFLDTEECPTCRQGIDETFKVEMLNRKETLLLEMSNALQNLGEDLKKAEDRFSEIEEILDDVREKEKQNIKLKSSIQAIDKYIDILRKEIDELENAVFDTGTEVKLELLNSELEDMNAGKNKLTEKKHYLDIIALMLKDSGIKTKIIKQYLPVINKFVNKYLAEMDFFANFTLDENFKELIHIRGSKERTYYQLSEGQKLRIDLAILFTWREIAKLKNSANTNLLLLDEIFESALDSRGVDDFLQMIQNLSKDTNIFVISPKGDTLVDKFSNCIKFAEYKGFTIMEEV